MPLRINRVARGLLSFLDSKTAGQPPQSLNDFIQCGIDLTEFFSSAQLVDMFGQVAAASTGVVGIALASNFMGAGGGAFAVPAGEVWLVRHVTARTGTLAAATTYNYTIGFQSTLPGIAGAATWHGLANQIAVGTFGTGQQATSSVWEPFVMQAGDQLGVHIGIVTVGTAETIQMTCRAMRLLV